MGDGAARAWGKPLNIAPRVCHEPGGAWLEALPLAPSPLALLWLQRGKLGASTQSQLAVDPAEMVLHCLWADV